MLIHVVNGDAPVGAIEETGLGGEIVVFREAMACGPCPGELALGDFLDARAAHLSQGHGEDLLRVRRDLGQLYARLDAIEPGDDVLLWFEDDLFCHVHLFFVLDRLRMRARARLVCPEGALGALPAAELARLAVEARPVDAALAAWGSRAWRAYAAADPRGLIDLMRDQEAPLPFSPIALRLHLERFPGVGDGLGRPERRILSLVAAGVDRFGDLLRAFWADEAGYGFGDAQVFHLSCALAEATPALLVVQGVDDPARAIREGEMRHASFRVTESGRAAVAGALDASAGAPLRWLGGVRLPAGQAPYRWDASAGALATPPAAAPR